MKEVLANYFLFLSLKVFCFSVFCSFFICFMFSQQIRLTAFCFKDCNCVHSIYVLFIFIFMFFKILLSLLYHLLGISVKHLVAFTNKTIKLKLVIGSRRISFHFLWKVLFPEVKKKKKYWWAKDKHFKNPPSTAECLLVEEFWTAGRKLNEIKKIQRATFWPTRARVATVTQLTSLKSGTWNVKYSPDLVLQQIKLRAAYIKSQGLYKNILSAHMITFIHSSGFTSWEFRHQRRRDVTPAAWERAASSPEREKKKKKKSHWTNVMMERYRKILILFWKSIGGCFGLELTPNICKYS